MEIDSEGSGEYGLTLNIKDENTFSDVKIIQMDESRR